MIKMPCPHCNRILAQTRADGRCTGCGKLLPSEMRAPSESALSSVRPHTVPDAQKFDEGVAWEQLVKEAYKSEAEPRPTRRNEFLESLPPLQRNAVLLWEMNNQVFNGGFSQWLLNGYGHWLNDIFPVLNQIGTQAAMEVQIILEGVSSLLHSPSLWTEEQEEMADLTDRYFQVMKKFCEDVGHWIVCELKRSVPPSHS